MLYLTPSLPNIRKREEYFVSSKALGWGHSQNKGGLEASMNEGVVESDPTFWEYTHTLSFIHCKGEGYHEPKYL
jgi:hypothetical protein